jgi:nuclear transport factor 2 (NTF2) superfamily protein
MACAIGGAYDRRSRYERFAANRISVRFEYEWQDATSGQWFRTHGNEHWEFDDDGLMRRRDMSANDIPIDASERRIGIQAVNHQPKNEE